MSYKSKVNIWMLHINIHVHRTTQSYRHIVYSTYIVQWCILSLSVPCALVYIVFNSLIAWGMKLSHNLTVVVWVLQNLLQQRENMVGGAWGLGLCCVEGDQEGRRQPMKCVRYVHPSPIDVVLLTTSKALMWWMAGLFPPDDQFLGLLHIQHQPVHFLSVQVVVHLHILWNLP